MDDAVVSFDAAPAGRPLLVCLGHAGSGAGEFRSWARAASGLLDIRAIRLPGREKLIGKPFLTSLDAAVEHVVTQLNATFDTSARLGLFGQCSGAIIVLEVARELERCGGVQPGVVGLAGLDPSMLDHDGEEATRAGSSRADLIESLRAAGTMSEVLLERPALMDIVIPIIQADMAIVDGYRLTPHPQLSVSLILAYDEAVVTEPSARRMRDLTRATFVPAAVPGGPMPSRADGRQLFGLFHELLSATA